MKGFPAVVYREVFGQPPRPAQVYELLAGIPIEAVIRFVAHHSYKLAAYEYASRDPDEFLALQHTFVLELAAANLGRTILNAVHTREVYRNGRWAFASPRGTARMLGAYLAANPVEVAGLPKDEHFERLAIALLIVNDLTLHLPEAAAWADMVYLFDYVQRPHWSDVLPRAFTLYGRQLPASVPKLGEMFSTQYEIDLETAVAVLFGLYGHQIAPLLGHLTPPPPPSPPFHFGILPTPDRASSHPGDKAIISVLDGWSGDYCHLGEAFARVEVSNPTVLPLVFSPLIRLSGDRLWCPDPNLLLTAATEGLFWRLNGLFKQELGSGEEFIALLGKPVFEDYLADLFNGLGRTDIERSGPEGDKCGFPDFWVREGAVLLVFEAKAGFLSEEAKYSRQAGLIDAQIKKLIGENQMANGIKRLLQDKPILRDGLERIIPVLITLDRSWGAPGLESRLNALTTGPTVGIPVQDIHVTPVVQLEVAGEWLRHRLLTRLLDWRRRFAAGGDLSISELLTDFRQETETATGISLPDFDAQQDARKHLHQAMNRVFEGYRKQAESEP